jgi:hypothetical protein
MIQSNVRRLYRAGCKAALSAGFIALPACRPGPVPSSSPPSRESTKAMASVTSFADDIALLSRHGHVFVLESPRGGRVAVSADYQGRVMTSAVEPNGPSLGFVNRSFIEQGKTATQFDNYGGEDRFWLGPEAGQYGLYFPAGKPFVFSNWQTPHVLQEGAWDVKDKSATHVTFEKSMTLANHGGAKFELRVERRVELASPEQVAAELGVQIPPAVKWVGFSTSNTIVNTGAAPWVSETGLLSVWILGMFAPATDMRVIVPFDKSGEGEIVNDRYFGKVPKERLTLREAEGNLLFLCDGNYRSKIGLGPTRAKSALGSYSEQAKLLTVISYTKPAGARRYVNSMWEMQKDPYAGDVVNSYNDGPTEPGKPSLGGFYEIESSSPAASLAPGASLTHVHRTFHFTGPREALDPIATKVLGVPLTGL